MAIIQTIKTAMDSFDNAVGQAIEQSLDYVFLTLGYAILSAIFFMLFLGLPILAVIIAIFMLQYKWFQRYAATMFMIGIAAAIASFLF